MAIKDYVCSALIGGGTGALDKIDGAGLTDGCMAKAVTDAGVYWYHLNATSGASLSSPFRIPPATNPGTKCWHLVGTTAFVGAKVKLTADQVITTATQTEVSWDAQNEDTGDFWEGVTNPTRFTVPEGVTRIDIVYQVSWTASSSSTRWLGIKKNGSYTDQEMPLNLRLPQLESGMQVVLIDHPVVANDYFEAYVYQDTGSNKSILYEPQWYKKTFGSITAKAFA